MRAAWASIGLHGAALVALFAVVEQRTTTPETSIVRFTLAERPLPDAPEPTPVHVDDRPLDEVPDPADTVVAEPAAEPNAEPVAERSSLAPAVDPRDPGDRTELVGDDRAAERTDEAAVDLQRLRRQFGALTLPETRDEIDPFATRGGATPLGAVPWQRSGEPIRGMPLGGGWLNPWLGPVEAYSETWGSVVGEQRGLHVLPNGQVVCTRVDAPTNDELMNPWMSMRVTYVRLCGRERGTAPPADDLRYPPPPSGLRRP